MLILSNLSIGYKSSAPVVSAIDAELRNGEFCCLIGRNGSGKSTLLRTIADILKPISGNLQKPLAVSLVLTEVPQLHNTTVRDMIAYGRLNNTGLLGRLRDQDYMAADSAIAIVGLQKLAARMLDELSDGEKQKTMIARAIAQEAPLMLLDEPSAFLDYPSKRELMNLLQKLAHNEGKTILLSTHDVELAKDYADKLWVIQDGKLEEKTPQDFHPEEL